MRSQGPYGLRGHIVRVNLLVELPKYKDVKLCLAAHARCVMSLYLQQMYLDTFVQQISLPQLQ